MPSDLLALRRGVIQACTMCSAPTTICGNALFTSSLSLTKAAKVTAALLIFNGFRLSICRNGRPFRPDDSATCPCRTSGDNLQQDSSMLICTTVFSPRPSVSRKLFHLQVAKACQYQIPSITKIKTESQTRSKNYALKTDTPIM